ncbi:MAG: hypothetical protein AAF399_29305, partial [Bacteroidota bacterium]
DVVPYLKELQRMCPEQKILASDYQVMEQKKALAESVTVFESMQTLIDYVDERSVRPFEGPGMSKIA